MSIPLYHINGFPNLLSSEEVQDVTGFLPNSRPEGNMRGMNAAGIFPFTFTPSPHDEGLYVTAPSGFSVSNYPEGAAICRYRDTDGLLKELIGGSGEYATYTWSKSDRPLDVAKTNGKQLARAKASSTAAAIAASSGYSVRALIAAASQLIGDRGADVQATLALQGSVMEQVATDIQAITAATT